MKRFIFFSVLTLVLFSSCKEDQSNIDEGLITDYLADKGLVAQSTASGVYYIIESEGFGIRPNISDQVTVHYEGRLLDDTKFDSSYDRGMPSTFNLNGVIDGWKIGIPLFKEGGSGTLIIPSGLAYGPNSPTSTIPSNSVLVFDIELIDVQ